jgi:Ni,Fe-hydrogenase III small subunit/formate hydrogenlyase subunit 6/NADH:ubiquinone oxidoreductase subunit I
MFRIVSKSLTTGIVTRKDPFASRPPFGFPVIDFKACTACDACVSACPTGALHSERPAPDRKTLSLSYALCIQCRECVEACPERAIHAGRESEMAAYSREQLTERASFDVDLATGRASFRKVEASPGPGLEESAAKLAERIRGRLGRSLYVRQVDAGSCNGCELEIAATANPVFDLERFGIHFVASPRHADVLLVTGPVTRNMEIALRRTYEATPEPRVVVAVGACGCSGGIFGEGTYASLGGVDRAVPVDVYVPGCPPRPSTILNGLLVAMGMRQDRRGPDGVSPAPETEHLSTAGQGMPSAPAAASFVGIHEHSIRTKS